MGLPDLRDWPSGRTFYIRPSGNTTLALDVEYQSKDCGARIHLWDFHGGASQQWKFEPNHLIRNVHSGKVLDVFAWGTELKQWDDNHQENQTWDLRGDCIVARFGKVIDVSGFNYSCGNKMSAWEYHGDHNQKFWLDEVNHPEAENTANFGQVKTWPTGTAFYILVESNNNMALDVDSQSEDCGAYVHLWEFHGGPSQIWIFEAGNIIRNLKSGKVLDVYAFDKEIKQWDHNNQVNQRWDLYGNAIISHHRHRALDVCEMKIQNGQRLCAWGYHGQFNQQFTLDPVLDEDDPEQSIVAEWVKLARQKAPELIAQGAKAGATMAAKEAMKAAARRQVAKETVKATMTTAVRAAGRRGAVQVVSTVGVKAASGFALGAQAVKGASSGGVGLVSMAGEFAGGMAGKELARATGNDEQVGKEIGAFGGAVAAGALAGSVVPGVGTAAGAAAGAMGYAIGKGVEGAFKAFGWE